MPFVQTIEFTGDRGQFERLLERYREVMGSETTAIKAALYEDRDRPGTFIEMVEFESAEAAQKNSDHPGTQQWAEEASALLGNAVYRNLDLVSEYRM